MINFQKENYYWVQGKKLKGWHLECKVTWNFAVCDLQELKPTPVGLFLSNIDGVWGVPHLSHTHLTHYLRVEIGMCDTCI